MTKHVDEVRFRWHVYSYVYIAKYSATVPISKSCGVCVGVCVGLSWSLADILILRRFKFGLKWVLVVLAVPYLVSQSLFCATNIVHGFDYVKHFVFIGL